MTLLLRRQKGMYVVVTRIRWDFSAHFLPGPTTFKSSVVSGGLLKSESEKAAAKQIYRNRQGRFFITLHHYCLATIA